MNDPTPQSRKLPMGWVLLLAVVGVALLLLAVHLGKDWSPGEFFYDLSLAIFAIAIIELLLLRLINAMASRKTELQLIVERIEAVDRHQQRNMQQLERQIRDIKADKIQASVHTIEQEMNFFKRYYLDRILAKLDPAHAEMLEKARNDKSK
jgi:hypothetical protein